MHFYYVLIHYIHIMLILKLLCAFRNSTVQNLYEHYSSTNTHAIVSVILSSSPLQCHNVLVAQSYHPYTVTEDVSLSRAPLSPRHNPSLSVAGASVTPSQSLSLSVAGASVTSSPSPYLYRGASVTIYPSL